MTGMSQKTGIRPRSFAEKATAHFLQQASEGLMIMGEKEKTSRKKQDQTDWDTLRSWRSVAYASISSTILFFPSALAR